MGRSRDGARPQGLVSGRRRRARMVALPGAACPCWGLFWFALAQAALGILMESRCPEVVAPDYGRRLACLRERLASEPERPLLLFLGTSRTELGVRPEVLPCYLAASG